MTVSASNEETPINVLNNNKAMTARSTIAPASDFSNVTPIDFEAYREDAFGISKSTYISPRASISITNTTFDTYTITVTNIPSNVVKIRFPTWTPASENQADLKWNIMPLPSGATSYSFTINRADYNFNNTHFVTDVYFEYNNATMTNMIRFNHGFEKIYTKITSSNSSSYTVTTYNVPLKIPFIQHPTWSLSDGQDDLIWYFATDKGNGIRETTIQRSSHNNEKGWFATHTYAIVDREAIGTGNNVHHDFNIPLTITDLNIVGESGNATTYRPDNTGRTIMVQGNPGEDSGQIILNYYASMDSYEKGYRADSNYFYVYNATTKQLVDKIWFSYGRKELTAWNKHSVLLNSGIVNVKESWLARYPNKDDIKEKSSLVQVRLNFSGGDAEYLIVPYSEVYMDDEFSGYYPAHDCYYPAYATTNATDYNKGIKVIVDSTKPTLRFLNEKIEWQNVSSYTLKWTASDSTSGLRNIGYQLGSGSSWVQFLPSPKDIVVTAEGKTAISIKADDNVYNSVMLSTYVAIDRSAPTIGNFSLSSNDTSLTLNISNINDTYSGLKELVVKVTNMSKPSSPLILKYPLSGNSASKSITLGSSELGNIYDTSAQYSVEVYATDNVGINSSVRTNTAYMEANPVISGLAIPFDKVGYPSYTDGKHPYKANNDLYWVRVGGSFTLYSEVYMPVFTKLYPNSNSIMLQGNGSNNVLTHVGNAGVNKDNITAVGSEGFSNNFTTISTSKLRYSTSTVGDYYNMMYFNITAKVNNATYKLYSRGGRTDLNKYNSWKDSGVTIKTDGTAPAIAITSSVANGTWTNQNVTVSFTSTDSGSGVKSNQINYTTSNSTIEQVISNVTSHTFTENGTYMVAPISIDNVGNSGSATTVFGIDKNKPTISGLPTNNSTFVNNKALSITASDTGGSGMKSITLYKNNSSVATGVSSISYIESSIGTHTYRVVALDNAGNSTENTFTMTILKEPSVGSLSVTMYDYKESDSVYWVKPNITGNIHIKTQTYYPSASGIYPTETQLGLGKLNYTAGTSSLVTATTSGTSSSGSEFSSNFTLSKGINKATTSVSGGNNILSFTHTLTAKLDNADYRLYSAGKYSSLQSSFVNSGILLKTDGTAPSITLNPANQEWTNSNVTVTIGVSDSRSGVENWTVKRKLNDGNWMSLNDKTTSISLTDNGTHIIEVTATDKVGNSSTSSITIKIDKNPPVITGNFTNDWVKGSKTLSFIAASSPSNVSSLKLYNQNKTTILKDGVISNGEGTLTHTISTEGITYYKIEAINEANNVATKDVVVKIDNTAPTAQITAPENTTELTTKLTLTNIVEEHSGLKEIQITEDTSFKTGVTTVALSGNKNKTINFTLKSNSDYESQLGERTIYIRLIDNVGNYSSYTININLIPKSPDKPVITKPFSNQLFVTNEPISVAWTYSSTDSILGYLPQLKADAILTNVETGSITTIEVTKETFSTPVTGIKNGTYDVRVKVYNFLNPDIYSISDPVRFRYNVSKGNGNVITKIINPGSPIKHLSILTKSEIPEGTSITGKIYYSVSSNGTINKSIYKNFKITYFHSNANTITLPTSVNKIVIEYELIGSGANNQISPALDHLVVLAK